MASAASTFKHLAKSADTAKSWKRFIVHCLETIPWV